MQVLVDGVYDQNDTISAFLNSSSSGLVSNGPGYMQIPQPDPSSGQCNDNNYATFENRVDPAPCVRTLSVDVPAFTAQCNSQQSVSRFVTDLWIAR